MAKVLGINDDEHECCLCGKSELKRVVWIEQEDDTIAWFGTTCAAKILKMDKPVLMNAIKTGKATATAEMNDFLRPFNDANNEAIIEIHKDRSKPLKERMRQIFGHPASIALKQAKNDARAKWPWLF